MVEKALREVFQRGIGAKDVPEATSMSEGITWNPSKEVFQATFKAKDQCITKEFKKKEDATHWFDTLRSLEAKGILKGHFAAMKQAEANRKATQEAYDKILSAQKMFVPEKDKSFARDPSKGKDIWKDMWKEPAKPVTVLPHSKLRISQNCFEKVKELGFHGGQQAEVLAWSHKTLGWRGVQLLTHSGEPKVKEEIQKTAADQDS